VCVSVCVCLSRGDVFLFAEAVRVITLIVPMHVNAQQHRTQSHRLTPEIADHLGLDPRAYSTSDQTAQNIEEDVFVTQLSDEDRFRGTEPLTLR
jgi:hypothetical protein